MAYRLLTIASVIKLGIMKGIHAKCVEHGSTGSLPNDNVDYVTGANIAGFIKVADAMVAYGAV